MTISKSDILSDVNARLGLSETDIDAEILVAIQQTVSLAPQLAEKTDTVEIADTEYSQDLPSGFAALEAVADADGLPLEKVDRIGDLLMKFRANSTAGDPTHYCIYADKIFVHPKSDGGHTLTLYEEYFDTSADDIHLPDNAQEALTESVCWQMEVERGLLGATPEQQTNHERLFMVQIQILQALYERRKGRK